MDEDRPYPALPIQPAWLLPASAQPQRRQMLQADPKHPLSVDDTHRNAVGAHELH